MNIDRFLLQNFLVKKLENKTGVSSVFKKNLNFILLYSTFFY